MTDNQKNDTNSSSNQISSSNSNSNLIVISIAIVILVTCGVVAYNSYQSSQRSENANHKSYTSKLIDSSMPGMDHPMGMSNDPNMSMKMPIDVKDDQSFLENMIPHHVEAVTSSKLILNKSSDLEIKEFAQAVITAQTAEINDMRSWYKTWFGKDYKSSASTSMMGDLSRFSEKDLDKAYLEGMIGHHKGAVDMANKIKTITQRAEIKQLAKNIIESQTKEIAILESWLKTKF